MTIFFPRLKLSLSNLPALPSSSPILVMIVLFRFFSCGFHIMWILFFLFDHFLFWPTRSVALLCFETVLDCMLATDIITSFSYCMLAFMIGIEVAHQLAHFNALTMCYRDFIRRTVPCSRWIRCGLSRFYRSKFSPVKMFTFAFAALQFLINTLDVLRL
jgi:hypothetical protein